MNKEYLSLNLSTNEFLEKFKDEWLENIEIENWQIEMGDKNVLCRVGDNRYDVIFAGEVEMITMDNLMIWNRILKFAGILIIENNNSELMKSLMIKYKGVFEYKIENNIYFFIKKKYKGEYNKDLEIVNTLKKNGEIEKCLEKLYIMRVKYPNNLHVVLYIIYIYMREEKIELVYEEIEKTMWEFGFKISDQNSITLMMATLKIQMNDYINGFKEREEITKYMPPERRTKTPPSEKYKNKQWNGESLKGKTLVVWTEFGLGDEIMFSQLAYFLKKMGTKKIIFIVQKGIYKIMKSNIYIDKVICQDKIEKELEDFDYYVYPYSILSHINIPFENIPKINPYLFVKEKDINKWNNILKNNKNINVGIVWKGSSEHENDEIRSIHNLQYLEEIIKNNKNINWYSFQKEINEKEKQLLNKYNVIQLGEKFKNMYDTGSALKNMDYLVTVDTSISHLAGALGIKTLLMLPYGGEWRWGNFKKENLWYPSITSFYCLTISPDWSNVIKEINDCLYEYAKK